MWKPKKDKKLKHTNLGGKRKGKQGFKISLVGAQKKGIKKFPKKWEQTGLTKRPGLSKEKLPD